MSLLVAAPRNLSAGWYLATGLFQAHRMWKWVIFGQTYGNSNNWLGLSIGHYLDYRISNNLINRWPFVAFLVGKRFLDFMQQKDAIQKSFTEWKWSLRGIQPLYLAERGDVPRFKWIDTSHTLLLRIQCIAVCTFMLCSEAFKTVMRAMDILEFVTFDQQQYEELLRISVQQAPLNLLQCMEALNRNEDIFLQRLEQEKAVIEKCLSYLGVPITSNDVIKNVSTFFEWSKSAQRTYKKVSAIFGDATTDLFKLIIQSVVTDDYKGKVNDLMKFDPNNNYWINNTGKMRYRFPAEAQVTKTKFQTGPGTTSYILNNAFSRTPPKTDVPVQESVPPKKSINALDFYSRDIQPPAANQSEYAVAALAQ